MQTTPSATAPYPQPPQGYVAASAQPYVAPPSAGATSQRSSAEPYNHDYGAAIDPALEATGNHQAQSAAYDGVRDLKRGLEDGSDGNRGEDPLHQCNGGFGLHKLPHQLLITILTFIPSEAN